jgi:hypothetical protein
MARGFLNELGKLRDRVDNWGGAALNGGISLAANGVVRDLQEAGPAWTGDFRNNWVVAVGDVEIPATQPRRAVVPKVASPAPAKTIPVPPIPLSKSGAKIKYTIGNKAEYRAIAMDLDPEQARTRPRGNGEPPDSTAPKDWFETYLNAGQIDKTIAASLGPELDKAWRRT